MYLLRADRLAVSVNGKPVLKEVNLKLKPGEIQALIGPNGSGKSSLLSAIAGLPEYKITYGRLFFNGQNVDNLSIHERARQGLFLAWQNPVIIPGINVEEFLIKISQLSSTSKSTTQSLFEIRQNIINISKKLKAIDLLSRDLNDGLSGGEKKRLEALQLAVIKPKLALIDEIDAGLDKANLDIIVKLIKSLNKNGTSFIIVSHRSELLKKFEINKFNFVKAGQLIAVANSFLETKE